jgi:anti-sigma factor RsiW
VTKDDARALFSDYLEGTLDPKTKDALQAFLVDTPETAAELIQFERTLTIMHRMPADEPRLDLWREFAPKMAEYKLEQKQGLRQRFGARWHGLVASFSAGLILYTHALAARTHERLERFLLQDPLDKETSKLN